MVCSQQSTDTQTLQQLSAHRVSTEYFISGVHSSQVTPWTQVTKFYLTKILIPWATALKKWLSGISLENVMKKLTAKFFPPFL